MTNKAHDARNEDGLPPRQCRAAMIALWVALAAASIDSYSINIMLPLS